MQPFKKVLLTGVNGQVGHAFVNAFKPLLVQDDALQLFALNREQLDLSNPDAIRRVVREIKPDLIINPAAYTLVDKAETESELAFAINALAPQILAEEAAKLNATLVHYSTDYVYDGTKNGAYDELDETNPISVYGKSKLAGEQAIQAVDADYLIFRTSWVYGTYGKNFLNTILRLSRERENLSIVADQFGAPTSSISIANATLEILNNLTQLNLNNQQGIYHLTNTGKTSWHGFATQIVEEYRANLIKQDLELQDLIVQQIKPITTAEYPTPAARPVNSVLSPKKLNDRFNVILPTWQQALKIALNPS